MTIVSALRSIVSFSCCVKSISKGKGKKKLWIDLMHEKRDWLVIDFDNSDSPLRKNETRPDFLFAGDTGGIPSTQNQEDPDMCRESSQLSQAAGSRLHSERPSRGGPGR